MKLIILGVGAAMSFSLNKLWTFHSRWYIDALKGTRLRKEYVIFFSLQSFNEYTMSHPASSSVLDRKTLSSPEAGFIGSHLCERLIAENNIICIDNFISGNQDNIAHLLTNPNFEFINHDISQPIDLESFPELERFNIRSLSVQQIYNLACPTSPKEFEKYKQETLDANSLGVKNMLDLAVQYRTRFYRHLRRLFMPARYASGLF